MIGMCSKRIGTYDTVNHTYARIGERMTFSVEPPADCPWNLFM